MANITKPMIRSTLSSVLQSGIPEIYRPYIIAIVFIISYAVGCTISYYYGRSVRQYPYLTSSMPTAVRNGRLVELVNDAIAEEEEWGRDAVQEWFLLAILRLNPRSFARARNAQLEREERSSWKKIIFWRKTPGEGVALQQHF